MLQIQFIRVFVPFAFAVSVIFLSPSLAQLPSSIIALEGNVIELTSAADFNIASNLPFIINRDVEFQCAGDGSFSVRIPYESDRLSIDIAHPDYEIIQPKDGQHFFETQITANTKYSLLIVVIGAHVDESLKLEIAAAQQEVERLKAKNVYTERQLQDLNRQYIDSIKAYHTKQLQYRNTISALEGSLSEFEGENRMKSDSIQSLTSDLKKIGDLRNKLIESLGKAMEEKYLRQKNLFSDLSEDLRLYLSRAKDVRDQLNILESTIKSGQLEYFNKSLVLYGESYEKIEGNKDEYVNGINHYWESEQLSVDLENVLTFTLEQIHKEEIYALNSTVIRDIQAAANGQRLRMKDIGKASKKTAKNLDIKLLQLENQIDELLNHLVIF